MSGFVFQVACLRLLANEPWFGISAVPKFIKLIIKNVQVVLLSVRKIRFFAATQLGVNMVFFSIITGISLTTASKGLTRFSRPLTY